MKRDVRRDINGTIDIMREMAKTTARFFGSVLLFSGDVISGYYKGSTFIVSVNGAEAINENLEKVLISNLPR